MLHAIAVYYNPAGYSRLRDNLRRFRDSFHGCTLTIIEQSFTGEFEYADSIRVHADPQKHTLWQKERLINIAAESLPPQVDKVAWIDADLHFCDPHWAERAEESLEKHVAIQLFHHVHYLDQQHAVASTRPAATANRNSATLMTTGGAWAARRELFPIMDEHVMGSGDSMMYHAFVGRHRDWGAWYMEMMTPPWRKMFVANGDRLHGLVNGNVGHLAGDVFHYWHGEHKDRKYVERWKYLTDFNFNPYTDIAIDDNGLWRWNSDKPDMHALVRYYFKTRNDDGIKDAA